jgi:RimJ/RimL family protein N-acetyltransferase
MVLEFLDLKKTQKENVLIYNQTISWIKTLTRELDFEDGESFTQFIKQALQLESPYGVFVLYDSSLSEVIGIASIVPDDEDVGKETNLKGLWVAGINIKREFRNRGYGQILFKNVNDYLSNLGVGTFRANLFVSNPYALRIYEKFGFKPMGLKVIRGGKDSMVCSKFYNE